jgi:alcohol dehydrogenase class IV
VFEGASGMVKMQEIMRETRNNPPADFAGYKVLKVHDFQSGLITDTDSGETEKIGLPKSIREWGIDEKTFNENLDKLVRLAFDDQCTGANPVYPLMSDIKQIYLDAYEGKY